MNKSWGTKLRLVKMNKDARENAFVEISHPKI